MKNNSELTLNIHPIKRGKNKSGLLIKTVITDHERIKDIMKKALSREDFPATIKLNNKWKAIPTLIEYKILSKDDIDKNTFFKKFFKEK